MVSFGAIPSPPDARDYPFTKLVPRLQILPQVCYLICPPVRDQGNLGSCVYHAFGYAMQSVEIQRGDEYLETFSLLFGYGNYNEIFYGDRAVDYGCMPRLALKLLQKDGLCMEKTWPYVTSRLGEKPPEEAYKEAGENQIIEYYALEGEMQRLQAIAAGFGFCCAVSVYESFYNATKGQVPIPDPTKENLLGYHMVRSFGYDRHAKVYHMENSWGEGWGDKGFFTLPFGYLDNPKLANDFWTIKTME